MWYNVIYLHTFVSGHYDSGINARTSGSCTTADGNSKVRPSPIEYIVLDVCDTAWMVENADYFSFR